jgi:hypothetical protein
MKHIERKKEKWELKVEGRKKDSEWNKGESWGKKKDRKGMKTERKIEGRMEERK